MKQGECVECRVEVRPSDAIDAGAAKLCYLAAKANIATVACLIYQNNCLRLRGRGSDGRCAVCRDFRLRLQRRELKFCFYCAEPNNCTIEELRDATELARCLDQTAVDPNDMSAYCTLGLIYERQGRFAEAISSLWRAYELNPQNMCAKARIVELLDFMLVLLESE
ncbi:MAG: tetratricopeptide repeat protein [Peptococcaceae bacterium]|nr:tetratricopeptide repeat protein [Peptococcaceae bacterium]